MNKKLLPSEVWFGLLSSYACLMLFLAIVYTGKSGLSANHVDKIIHFIEFTVLSWLAVQTAVARKSRKSFWQIWLLCAAYGLALELIQWFVPWRSPEFADFCMNCLGAGMGIGVAKWILRPLGTKA